MSALFLSGDQGETCTECPVSGPLGLPGPLGPKGQQGEKQRARLCFGIFVLFLRLCITLDVFILGHPGLAGSKGEKGVTGLPGPAGISVCTFLILIKHLLISM